MRSAAQILQELRDRGVSQGKIAKVLGVAQPNATKLYTPDARTGKQRSLGYDEAVKLIEAFGLDEANADTAPKLPSERTIQWALEEVLRLSAQIELPASLSRPTARHLRLCLELLARNPAILDNADAIRAVADAAGTQFHEPTQDA